MTSYRVNRATLLSSLAIVASAASLQASAVDTTTATTIDPAAYYGPTISNKLLFTGGLSQLEGSAGGGLTPWAVIGGYGTNDEIGGNAFYTNVNLPDYRLGDIGAMVGFYNRVELSLAQERFDTQQVGAALGLGEGFRFQQNIVGLKVRLFGDAVLDQDSWVPQVSMLRT